MLNKKNDPDMSRVPLWKKMNLTVEEAAEYSGTVSYTHLRAHET